MSRVNQSEECQAKILSDLSLLVQCATAAQYQQQQHQQLGELEIEQQLWCDSSPEHVTYCDSDLWDPCDMCDQVDQCNQSQCVQVDQDQCDQVDHVSLSMSSSDISSDSNFTYVDSEAEEMQLQQEIFVGNLLEAIDIAASGSVFNRRKSDRKTYLFMH